MANDAGQPGPERVHCALCLREMARADSPVSDLSDREAYFCGMDCYEIWRKRRYHELGTPEPEVQLGHDRSKVKDERMKAILKQHPQRDEPRLDGVEPDEAPPRLK